ncbi:uncharacterized protein PRD47_018386 isoform 1-T3 [Ara ararauna]
MPHPSPEVMKTLKEIERWQALLLHSSPTQSLFLLKQLLCSQKDCRNLPPRPDLLLHKHPTKLCLGDEHPSSRLFSTTQQSDCQPPEQSERVMADSRSPRESHVPFNYHTDECSVTTMPHWFHTDSRNNDPLKRCYSRSNTHTQGYPGGHRTSSGLSKKISSRPSSEAQQTSKRQTSK